MRSVVSIGLLATMVAGVAIAQDYPSRPVRIIVSEAGSSPDIVARTIAQGITGPLGQPVIVDNRRPLLIPEILFPGVPTVAASGLPGYEYVSTLGVFAPAHTPISIIEHLHREIVRVVLRAEVKERFFNLGADVVASTPAQFMARTKSELALWSKVIRAAGIEAE